MNLGGGEEKGVEKIINILINLLMLLANQLSWFFCIKLVEMKERRALGTMFKVSASPGT